MQIAVVARGKERNYCKVRQVVEARQNNISVQLRPKFHSTHRRGEPFSKTLSLTVPLLSSSSTEMLCRRRAVYGRETLTRF